MITEKVTKHALWTHQQIATDAMRGKRTHMLHMAMGTGKTLTVIDRILRSGARKWLIVCPKSVQAVWTAELEKHANRPVDVVPLSGKVQQKADTYENTLPSDRPVVVIVNYESLWRAPLGSAVKHSPPDGVVYDEIQRLAGAGSRVSKYCRDLRPRVPCVIGLSGTVPGNHPEDIYAVYRALDSKILGTSKRRFLEKYFRLAPGPHPSAPLVLNEHSPGALSRAISPITTRIGAEVLDLPPLTVSDRFVKLAPGTRKVYEELQNVLISELEEGTITAANALVKALRLRQVTSGTAATDWGKLLKIGREKEDLLTEILKEIGDEPVVMFCNFRSEIEATRRVFPACYEVSGRINELTQWESGVLACQIQAGGVGVDLSRARYAVFYSLPYSRGVYDQAIARLHRSGQEHPVSVLRLLAADTIDVGLAQSLEEKKEKIDNVLDLL